MVRPWIPALVWLAASDSYRLLHHRIQKQPRGGKLASDIEQAGGEVLDKFNSRFFYGLSVGSGYWHLAMTQVDKMHKEGFTGTGIKVDIIDTGVNPPTLSFNDTDYRVASISLCITNTARSQVTCQLSSQHATTLYTAQPSFFEPDPIKAESPRKPLKLRLPTYLALNLSACPSGLVIVNGTDGTSLSIPYLGLAGSLRSAWRIYPGKPVLKIAGADGESTYPSTDAFVFNDLQSGQKPGPSNSVERKDAGASLDKVFVAIHLPLASPKLRLDMFAGTKSVGQLPGSPFNLFSRQTGTIDITHWNGSFAPGQYAPSGRYQFALHALALFGNPDNESDLHTSLLNDFSIAYKHKIKLWRSFTFLLGDM
ncbi:peptidase S8 family protein [Metarhizium robertsii]|uniref:Peptidase S8 family protein n=1 Tax=Metarhizium robertsii TaxID=568076 RepID=A0A014QSY3_9HYPO|nr:peptidase S8 family protein [Metarhizium robertsii]